MDYHAMSFEKKLSQSLYTRLLNDVGMNISQDELTRIGIAEALWNIYEGEHWNDLSREEGTTQLTFNYAKKVVNKFIAFEFGKGFGIKLHSKVEPYVLPFLNAVLTEMNNIERITHELGQDKNITGDSYVYCRPVMKGDDGFEDPYGLYPKGYIKLYVLPSKMCLPEYSKDDPDKLVKLTTMHPYVLKSPVLLGMGEKETQTILRVEFTAQKITTFIGKDEKESADNPYGAIPVFRFPNVPMLGRNYNESDIDDIVPLNKELNLKESETSDTLAYHATPLTLVFGARVTELERGLGSIISGLPENARVENLELKADMGSTTNYTNRLKSALYAMSSVPEMAFGENIAISNTSGVALQVAMMPVLERTSTKQGQSGGALKELLRYIIHVGIKTGILEEYLTLGDAKGDDVPTITSLEKFLESVKTTELYNISIQWEDVLPKDLLVELQQIQLEMKLGLTSRKESMKRLGKKDIERLLVEIDKEREEHPELFDIKTQMDIEQQIAEILKTRADAATAGVSTGEEPTGGMKREDGLNIMKRKLGTNKEGKDSEVNAGLQNGPTAKK